MYEREAIKEALRAAGIEIDDEDADLIVKSLHEQNYRLASVDGPSPDD